MKSMPAIIFLSIGLLLFSKGALADTRGVASCG